VNPSWSRVRTNATNNGLRANPQVEPLEDRQLPSAVSYLTAPVIPVIDAAMAAHLQAIHAQGLLLGNHDDAFSRVGDSITATPNFLASIGSPGYSPGLLGDHLDLASTIAFYREHAVDVSGNNSFNHVSLAAGIGWSSATLLAGPASRTPLALEFSATHPSVSLIMIGTNDVIQGVDPQVFRANLTAIVDTAISLGAIPVLSTIPYMTGGALTVDNAGVSAVNQVIVEVAATLDVPLLNYWRALQALPGEGIDLFGVHPSSAPFGSAVFTEAGLAWGYNVRNLIALQVLAEIRGLIPGSDQISAASFRATARAGPPSQLLAATASLPGTLSYAYAGSSGILPLATPSIAPRGPATGTAPSLIVALPVQRAAIAPDPGSGADSPVLPAALANPKPEPPPPALPPGLQTTPIDPLALPLPTEEELRRIIEFRIAMVQIDSVAGARESSSDGEKEVVLPAATFDAGASGVTDDALAGLATLVSGCQILPRWRDPVTARERYRRFAGR
jgi:GDSL-like Lipase/Acylhydrolase family